MEWLVPDAALPRKSCQSEKDEHRYTSCTGSVPGLSSSTTTESPPPNTPTLRKHTDTLMRGLQYTDKSIFKETGVEIRRH